jgi:ribosomal protein S27E
MVECDYCKEETNLEEFEAGEGSIRKLDIVFIPQLRHLQVRIQQDDNTKICFGINERFNYCPMCGRKLPIRRIK